MSRASFEPIDKYIGEILYTEQQVDARIVEMAEELRGLDQAEDPVYLGLAQGGIMFTKKLMAEFKRQKPSYLPEVALLRASTYRDGDNAGTTLIGEYLTPPLNLQGRVVRLLDDVLDTGKTANPVMDNVRGRGADAVDFIPFVRKDLPRPDGPEPFLVGFDAPNEWLLGMGMDFNGIGRNLGYIAIMNRAAVEEA